MSDGTTGPEGEVNPTETPAAQPNPAAQPAQPNPAAQPAQPNPAAQQVVPPATGAFPQQPQQAWGQQAWSDQSGYPQQHGAPQPYGAAPQYGVPQQAQYPAAPQQGVYPVPGQYPQAPQYQGYPQGQQPPQQPGFGQQYPVYGQQQYPGQAQPGQPQPGQYPQAFGQYPAGMYPTPTTGAAPKSKMPLWIGLGGLAVVAVVGLVLAVSGVFGNATLDQTAAEKGVEDILTGTYQLTEVENVECPSGQTVAEGASFTCTVTVEGTPQEVTVTFTDDDGTYSVSRPVAK